MRSRTRTRAGTMRHFCRIDSPPTATDALGQPSGDWTQRIHDVPCKFTVLSGDELEVARFKFDSASYEVVIYRPTGFEVTEAMRVIVKTALRTYSMEIGHVGPVDDFSDKLSILCKDVV